MNDNLFLSICVPTRNRVTTLEFCLKTLIDQNIEEYEIIVSDNSDFENRHHVSQLIDNLNCNKIKYFETPSVFTMQQNFEYALSKVKGDFVMFIGDDDGLVLNSLKYVYDFIKKNIQDLNVLKCPSFIYHWPNSLNYPESRIAIPQVQPITYIDSKSLLEKVINFEIGYFTLPMIYYAFVNYKIIDAIISTNGSFFANCNAVDIFSGLLISSHIDKHVLIDRPFTIAGISAHSNGDKMTSVANASENDKDEFGKNQLKEVLDLNLSSKVKYTLATTIYIDILKFLKLYPQYIKNDELQLFNYLANILLNKNSYSISDKQEIIQDFYNLGYNTHVLDQISMLTSLDNSILLKHSSINNLNFYHSAFNPVFLGVKDVYSASILCNKIVNKTLSTYEELAIIKVKKKNNIFRKLIFNLFKKMSLIKSY